MTQIIDGKKLANELQVAPKCAVNMVINRASP